MTAVTTHLDAVQIANAALMEVGHKPTARLVQLQGGGEGLHVGPKVTPTTYRAGVLAMLAVRVPDFPVWCIEHCVTRPRDCCYSLRDALMGRPCQNPANDQ